MAPELEDYWFAKGRWCDARPIVWQGHVATGAYAAVVAASALLVERSLPAFLAIVLVATGLFIALVRSKTRPAPDGRSAKGDSRC